MTINRKRYTASEVAKNEFYQLPKFLFDEEFKGISNDARVLYSLLRDRHRLSLKNNWINEDGEVYLIYTRDNMAEMLGCSLPTVRKAINALKKFNLIDDVRQGLNKPNLIYLLGVSVANATSHWNETSFQSGEKEPFTLEGKNLSPSKSNYNKTNNNKNHYISEKNSGESKEITKEENGVEEVDNIGIEKESIELLEMMPNKEGFSRFYLAYRDKRKLFSKAELFRTVERYLEIAEKLDRDMFVGCANFFSRDYYREFLDVNWETTLSNARMQLEKRKVVRKAKGCMNEPEVSEEWSKQLGDVFK